MSSTNLNVHEGSNYYWSVDDTDIATINPLTGVITFVSPGKVKVTVQMQCSVSSAIYSAQITYSCEIPIENGGYFIQNFDNEKYIQPNYNSSSNSISGSLCYVGDFAADTYQKWDIEHLGLGYYKIISSETGNALTVPSSGLNSSSVQIEQTLYVGGDNQKWKILQNEDGTYSLIPKSNSSYCLAADSSSLKQMTSSTDDSDAWIFEIAGDFVEISGDYFIQNMQSEKYLQPNYDLTTETLINNLFYLGDYQSDSYQMFKIEHIENGKHKIITRDVWSQVITVPSDNINVDGVQLQQAAYVNSDNQHWKIMQNPDGTYTLFSCSNPSYRLSINGTSLIQSATNTDNRSKWLLYELNYGATVNTFYDKGYSVRYNETEQESIQQIKEYNIAVSERFMQLFGLFISFGDISYYNSDIDQCKGTVTSENIDASCSHAANHTNLNSVMSDFSGKCGGSNVITGALWTGHKIDSLSAAGEPEFNRSYSSGNYIYILEISMTNRSVNSTGTLMHELAHQYGARDHYHERTIKNEDSSCKNKDICSDCNENDPNKRPESCIMYNSRQDINSEAIFCEECMEDILQHLTEHH